MGGFVDHFMSSAEWPQDVVFTGSPWAGGAFSLTNPSRSYGAAEPASAAVDGAAFPGVAAPPHAKLHEQLLGFAMDYGAAASSERAMMAGTALGSMFDAPAACQMALTESAPVICSSSSNESRGSEQSALPGFLVGEQHVPAWPAAYAGISSMAGEETQQSFGFDRLSNGDLVQEANANKYPQLQLHDDIEFDTGKLLSFAPGQLVTPNIDNLQIDRKDDTQFDTGKLLPFTPGQQVTPITGNLQIDRKEFSGAHHLNLSSLISGPHASFSATQSHSQPAEAFSGKTGSAAPFVSLPEVPNGNGGGGNGAPKPRVRARRGQATDPHSIAERLRREKISDRMNNLQELVPNSNKTDKASMLDEIIDYVKFLQLQVKVLSMSRLGAAEAVVPLLTERQTESLGLLLSPRSAGERQQAGAEAAGGLAGGGQSELQDGGAADAFEHEVVQLMENNMTAAMQYLQSKGLCLMPVALASAISTQKGTSSAAVRPENAAGAPKAPRGRSLKETKSIA